MNIVNGNKVWRNPAGQFHRKEGPAIEYANGDKKWWVNGQLHREDGPAEEWANGSKVWYMNSQLHRTDGPAFETVYGDKQWWFRNKKVSKLEVETQVCQLNLKVLLLTRAVNPFCEINVAKYAL
jgi:hypothetical protein